MTGLHNDVGDNNKIDNYDDDDDEDDGSGDGDDDGGDGGGGGGDDDVGDDDDDTYSLKTSTASPQSVVGDLLKAFGSHNKPLVEEPQRQIHTTNNKQAAEKENG